MNYSPYLKMSSIQLDEEISKQKSKIKNINETIGLLKKLKIAAEVLEKEQNDKTENAKNDQNQKSENLKPEISKVTVDQPTKPQNQQTTTPNHHQPQQPKPSSGGVYNGIGSKIHR